MSPTNNSAPTPDSKGLSLDTWAVVVALALALIVRFGIIQKVSW